MSQKYFIIVEFVCQFKCEFVVKPARAFSWNAPFLVADVLSSPVPLVSCLFVLLSGEDGRPHAVVEE